MSLGRQLAIVPQYKQLVPLLMEKTGLPLDKATRAVRKLQRFLATFGEFPDDIRAVPEGVQKTLRFVRHNAPGTHEVITELLEDRFLPKAAPGRRGKKKIQRLMAKALRRPHLRELFS